jgi:hypothetical protein
MSKSMKYLPSFGGGYGINRNVKGSSALGVAEPPLARGATRQPGSAIGAKTGHSQKSHYAGAKVIGAKK